MHESFDSYTTELLAFRPRLQCHRSGPGAPPPMMLSARDVEARILAKYGARDMNLCESITADTMVKPFFDFERYHDSQPADHVISAVHTNCIDMLRQLFCLEDSFPVATSSRCGPVNGGRYKVSFHFIIQGYALKVRFLFVFFQPFNFLGFGKFSLGTFPNTVNVCNV